MPITYGDLRNPPSTLANKCNLCPTAPEFADLVNRAHLTLLEHGSWWGTEQEADFVIRDACITLPGVVAALEGLRACNEPVRIENGWYKFLPGFNPQRNYDCGMWWEYKDQVCTFMQWGDVKTLRSYPLVPSDVGRKIKYLGYDRSGKWVRTRQDGLYQDGEQVTLASPYVDTVTQFLGSPVAVIKDETDDIIRTFSYTPGDDSTLQPVAQYNWWETRPTFQRFRIHGYRQMSNANGCCPSYTVTAKVKLAYIPVQYDDDLLLIQNRQAMEYAVQAMKAIDDGNLQQADVLLNGDGKNLRLGAIPLLQQELRTHTADRFAGNVRVSGLQHFRRKMLGFV